MPHSSNWQEALNPPFVQRLLRPLRRPGRIDPHMTNRIVARYQAMTPLPLVAQLTQRQTRMMRSEGQPIVFAQPALPQPSIASTVASPAPTSGAPTIIQAKFVSSSGAPNLPLPAIQTRSDANSSTSGVLADSPPDSAHFLAEVVERSPLPGASLPDLPLIRPVQPSSLAENPPPLRPRRPRFERDIQLEQTINPSFTRSDADLNADFADQRSPVLPSLKSPATTLLPFATAPDRSIALFQPTVSARPLTEVQHQWAERTLPLVSIGLSQTQTIRDRPSPPVVPPKNRIVDPTVVSAAPRNSLSLPLDLPLIQISQSNPLQNRPGQPTGASHPLVFSTSAVSPISRGNVNGATHEARNSSALSRVERGYSAAEFGRSVESVSTPSQALPVVSAQAQPSQQPTVDVDALADKVERKLMRRLVVERERRGLRS